ncbi:MAG: LLM class F420-dependent oxidoreductase [Ardenticatenaceae bacterium]|nr:LLM class F420-dependent oxidoreductase [Ardenticatenaceae bacterium]
MHYGLYGINQNTLGSPEAATAVAKVAEDAGFDSIWVGEHVVLPESLTPPPYMEPTDPILDPIVALSFLAAHTHKILLGTGVIILPQRNPLVLAKELASLDVLSRGRLAFGLGVGYLEPEMRAIGIPMENRGTRSEEYLKAILALWTQPSPVFSGRFVNFDGIQAYPRPVQRPHPPIVIGGRSQAAHRRAIQYGDGWYGFNLNLEETAEQIAGLQKAACNYIRCPGLHELEISVTPRDAINREDARQYGELGVHRLILKLPHNSPINEILTFVRSASISLIAPV